jgi:hypothetical protein
MSEAAQEPPLFGKNVKRRKEDRGEVEATIRLGVDSIAESSPGHGKTNDPQKMSKCVGHG